MGFAHRKSNTTICGVAWKFMRCRTVSWSLRSSRTIIFLFLPVAEGRSTREDAEIRRPTGCAMLQLSYGSSEYHDISGCAGPAGGVLQRDCPLCFRTRSFKPKPEQYGVCSVSSRSSQLCVIWGTRRPAVR